MKEYSTVELNNLARKELLTTLRVKDLSETLPKTSSENDPESDSIEITTKNYVEHLKDLEEDPLGTPRPNLPDNRVIVVTTPTTT